MPACACLKQGGGAAVVWRECCCTCTTVCPTHKLTYCCRVHPQPLYLAPQHPATDLPASLQCLQRATCVCPALAAAAEMWLGPRWNSCVACDQSRPGPLLQGRALGSMQQVVVWCGGQPMRCDRLQRLHMHSSCSSRGHLLPCHVMLRPIGTHCVQRPTRCRLQALAVPAGPLAAPSACQPAHHHYSCACSPAWAKLV